MTTMKIDPAVMRSNDVTKEGLAVVKADLATVKADVGAIRANYATKEDLARLEASMMQWFIGTSIAACGVSTSIAFALVKLVH